MSSLIQSRIAAVRRKHASVRAALGICAMVMLMVGVLTIEMCCDWFFDLPYTLRAIILALHGAALLYLLGYRVIWPLIKGPDDETVALWIESCFPEAASRIISAVQFSRIDVAAAGGSAVMAGQVVREAEEFIQPRDTGEAVSTDLVLKRFALALLLIVVAGGLFIWGRPNSQTLLMRSLAIPGVQVPRKTRIEMLTPDPLVVARGDTVVIAARASGVIPSEGVLKIQYPNGATADYPLQPDDKDSARFNASINNVQDGFTYRVQLNDAHSDSATVEAHDRPTVASLAIEQIYPAYTRLKPAKMNSNDLTVLAGSRLTVRVTASEPLKATRAGDSIFNCVTLAGVDQSFELRPDSADPKTYIVYESNQPGIIVPAKATGLAIHLVDELGLQSKDDASHPLQVVPDNPPVVKITAPTTAEELVTEKAKTTIGFDITDDFGLAYAKIKYRPAGPITGVTGDGITATYFKGDELAGDPLLTRVEPGVNLDYNRKAVPNVPHDHFTVRWTGKLIPPETGNYHLIVKSDDGVRIWIDGQQVIDQWGPFSGNLHVDSLPLEAGKVVDVKVEYLQLEGAAECKLNWQRPTNVWETIGPKYWFSSDAALTAAREKQVRTIDLNVGDTSPTAPLVANLRGRYIWDLSPLHLSPGDALEWWVEAADANDQTGPGITQSEHHIVRIGTEAAVREALLNKLGDYFQQIQDVQDGQKDLTSKLGQIIVEKPAPADTNK